MPTLVLFSLNQSALIKQYKELFELEGIELIIDNDVYDFMVSKAMEYKLGARGLRSICESILTDAMFDLPGSDEKQFHLTLDYAMHKFDKSKLGLLKVA
jgi:ATP-dependent Clp protease ATP-binding subunit ClpX